MQETLALRLTRRIIPPDALLRNLLLVFAGSLIVAALAQVTIPLQPVPITAQTFGVLLVGAALGARRGAASLLLYVFEGVLGAPVFAGGASGLARLLGPTGGYLIGFIAAAYLVGHLAERGWDRRWLPALFTFFVGELAIFAVGVSWLAVLIGLPDALLSGLLPFLPGEVIKVMLAALALPSAWALVNRME